MEVSSPPVNQAFSQKNSTHCLLFKGYSSELWGDESSGMKILNEQVTAETSEKLVGQWATILILVKKKL